VTVDAANGVGGPKLRLLLQAIGSDSPLSVDIIRDDITTPGALNNSCGADYVKTSQKAPPGLQLVPGSRYCSLDGDADRIVYYYQDTEGTFRLLDGDKIATLAAMYVIELVKQAGLDLEVGVVQTAYANGSSSAYITKVLVRPSPPPLFFYGEKPISPDVPTINHFVVEQNIPVTVTSTGVKHLHHAAEKYEIGVYFEANGHGTVIFSPTALETIRTRPPSTPAQQEALEALKALTEVINQTVGDALSDFLLVEAILLHRQWGPKEWDGAYNDLPNRLVKVLVGDRAAFTTADAERRLVTPAGLQEKIEALMAKYQLGRTFVRPSGTEDCVRVYAEAATRVEADGTLCDVPPLHRITS
jgi:phosphoacetylglucosamine mutase